MTDEEINRRLDEALGEALYAGIVAGMAFSKAMRDVPPDKVCHIIGAATLSLERDQTRGTERPGAVALAQSRLGHLLRRHQQIADEDVASPDGPVEPR